MFPKIKGLGVQPKRCPLLTGEKHLVRLTENTAATQTILIIYFKENLNMAEELTNVSGTEMSDANIDYVAAIKELQNNTVSKEQYTKLRAENKKLLDALVTGGSIENPIQKPEVDIDALRKELFNKDTQLTNLEFIEKSLTLRDALIDKGEPDPFLPIGSRISPTPEEARIAENVADIYRECIEYADGDSEVFTNELMRRTVDVMPASRGARKR